MRILFVDPGSKSAGWAFFIDGSFHSAGSLTSKHKDGFQRLGVISENFRKIVSDLSPNEVHFETLNYRTHYICIWAVGSLGAIAASCGVQTVAQDVYIKSWQKHCNWEEIQYKWEEVDRPWVFDTEDAWAAYWQGIWWLHEHTRKENKKNTTHKNQ
jgi:hypothetical protein